MENIIKKYLESGELHCHYCNSSKRNTTFIFMFHKYADGSCDEIYLSEQCNACGKCRTARYKQIGIEGKSGEEIVQQKEFCNSIRTHS